MEEQRFRGDLFYRINVIEIHVPSLRERKADIEPLADHILRLLAAEWQLATPRLSEDALELLQSHDFPGNVRELENILERAYTLCEGDCIVAGDLQLPQLVAAVMQAVTPDAAVADFAQFPSLEEYLEHIEKSILLRTLEQHRWNRTAAAKSLGMSFRQLRYRLQKLGLDRDD
jgi:two-component system response regulator PilR (NtrC family)